MPPDEGHGLRTELIAHGLPEREHMYGADRMIPRAIQATARVRQPAASG